MRSVTLKLILVLQVERRQIRCCLNFLLVVENINICCYLFYLLVEGRYVFSVMCQLNTRYSAVHISCVNRMFTVFLKYWINHREFLFLVVSTCSLFSLLFYIRFILQTISPLFSFQPQFLFLHSVFPFTFNPLCESTYISLFSVVVDSQYILLTAFFLPDS